MQCHDQRTAGIPGIFPMYQDMKGRVAEKLAKGTRITILKHDWLGVASCGQIKDAWISTRIKMFTARNILEI